MEFTPEFYKQLLDHLAEGVYFVDRERRILYWNGEAGSISGYPAEEVLHSFCYNNILDHVDERMNPLCSERCPLVHAMETGKAVEARVFLRHKRGHRVPVDVKVAPVRNGEGVVVGAVEVFSDATPAVQIERINEDLRQLIHVDPLTRIPNRRALMEALEREFQRFRRYGTCFSLIFTDIDHFKVVNDTFGHAAGDGALQWVARRIGSFLRKSDFLGRYGGEEFLILLPATEAGAAEQTAEHLRERLAASACPYTETIVTASFGVTEVLPQDTPESLVERADAALYASKRHGRNRVTRM